MKTGMIPLILLALSLAGCATNQAPPEPEISVKLRGTAVEVQNFIEERLRNSQATGLRVESATDRVIVFKARCTDTLNMNPLKCAAVMMAIGNSGWDGPYAVLTFRTAEIRGVVNLTANAEWCATNAFGKTNCMPNGTNAERNSLLRNLAEVYGREVRPL
ncbi:MAG: hypothetical protein LWW83_06335 [Azonexaceae bacterium]|nr:hypothetical protein [Azonexaceae bacterium]